MFGESKHFDINKRFLERYYSKVKSVLRTIQIFVKRSNLPYMKRLKSYLELFTCFREKKFKEINFRLDIQESGFVSIKFHYI